MENPIYIPNEKKALVIHLLFSREIPYMLERMQFAYEMLKEHEKEYRSIWSYKISYDDWLSIAQKTNEIIEAERKMLIADAFYFSERLALNDTVEFVNDCIVKYAKSSQNLLLISNVNHFYIFDS